MKNKKKIALATAITLIASIVIIITQNFEMIRTTYRLCKVEIQLSWYYPKLEHHTTRALELDDIVNELHEQRGLLDSQRKDLSYKYLSAQEAID